MFRSIIFVVAVSSCLWGCLEDDPNYMPSDSSAGAESGTSADTTGTGSGTGTTGTTDTGTTDTGTTDTGTTDTGTTDTGTTDASTTTGVMCDPPMELCADACVDTSTDKNNCGMCFNKCNPAQEQCLDSMCVPK